MKFGVVIFPSKKLQDLANSYRKRYDPHYSLISPHLTLKGPFEATEDSVKEIAGRLQEIAESTVPIKLNVLKVGSFKPVNNVIYFKVKPTEELLQLHKDLHTEFIGEQPHYNFVPHITIGQKLTDAEHSDVFGSLRLLKMEHEETVDRFHLLYQLENEFWTVYDTFRFRKD